jgi:osmotically-inducible protein OsmY
MANASTPTEARPDIDILADVETAITQYPPTVNDRHHIQVKVMDGVVELLGYIKTSITRQYLLDNLILIKGVRGVDVSRLYDDETLRRDIGQHIPMGVWANVEYGHVILTGQLPDGVPSSTLAAKISSVAGVRDIRTKFIG